MGRSKLLERTDQDVAIREVVSLGRRHEEILQEIIAEVHSRTKRRPNKSTVVRTLIESFGEMGLTAEDIINVHRARREGTDLIRLRESLLTDIRATENDLRRALIEKPCETHGIRQYRKTLRYQNERLKAVEQILAHRD